MNLLNNLKISIPLTGLAPVKSFFGDHDPAPPDPETPSAHELAEANAELKQINADIRDRDGRDVKTIKDMLER